MRSYEVRLPADWPPASVTANGASLRFTLDAKQLGWRFEGNTLTTIVPVAPTDVHQATTIVVRRAPGSLTSRNLLDGFTGRMRRLREAYDTLSADYPATCTVPDDVTTAMQTGNRIGYHPETAGFEIEALAGRSAAALSATETLQNDIKSPTSYSPPMTMLPREILSALRRTKLACNVPSQTCMMRNDYSDIVADLKLFYVAAGRKSFCHTQA